MDVSHIYITKICVIHPFRHFHSQAPSSLTTCGAGLRKHLQVFSETDPAGFPGSCFQLVDQKTMQCNALPSYALVDKYPRPCIPAGIHGICIHGFLQYVRIRMDAKYIWIHEWIHEWIRMLDTRIVFDARKLTK